MRTFFGRRPTSVINFNTTITTDFHWRIKLWKTTVANADVLDVSKVCVNKWSRAQTDGSRVASLTSVQLRVPSFRVISPLLGIPVDFTETRPRTTRLRLLHLTHKHTHLETSGHRHVMQEVLGRGKDPSLGRLRLPSGPFPHLLLNAASTPAPDNVSGCRVHVLHAKSNGLASTGAFVELHFWNSAESKCRSAPRASGVRPHLRPHILLSPLPGLAFSSQNPEHGGILRFSATLMSP